MADDFYSSGFGKRENVTPSQNPAVQQSSLNRPTSQSNSQMGTNSPNGEQRKRQLTEADKQYLSNIALANSQISSARKKKKARLTRNARALTRVRRMYAVRISHAFYPFPVITVGALRDLLDPETKRRLQKESKKKSGKKGIIAILLILLLLVSGGGVGAFMFTSSSTQTAINPNGAGLTFQGLAPSDQIVSLDDSYEFGKRLSFPVVFSNNTNVSVYVAMKITLTPTNANMNVGDLVFNCYDSAYGTPSSYVPGEYYLSSGNVVKNGEDSNILQSFSISCKNGVNENDWANQQVSIKFQVVCLDEEEYRNVGGNIASYFTK